MPGRLFLVAWLLVASLPAYAGLPDPPAPLDITTDEQASLDKGDIVFRVEETDLGFRTIAIIDVGAPPRAVIDAVLDVGARAREVGSIRDVDIYDRPASADPEEMGVRWTLSVVGREVVFHTRYVIDRDAAWCVYALDPAHENDVKMVEGSYQAYTRGSGSRLVYRSVTDAGTAVPEWLRRWLVSGSLKDQLDGIKARAEQPPAGSSPL